MLCIGLLGGFMLVGRLAHGINQMLHVINTGSNSRNPLSEGRGKRGSRRPVPARCQKLLHLRSLNSDLSLHAIGDRIQPRELS